MYCNIIGVSAIFFPTGFFSVGFKKAKLQKKEEQQKVFFNHTCFRRLKIDLFVALYFTI
jgi:hypothetical protein